MAHEQETRQKEGTPRERAARLTHRQYEEQLALRDRLTQEGLRRALAPEELDSLREARDLCAGYLDFAFGNAQPVPAWQPPARRPSTIRRA